GTVIMQEFASNRWWRYAPDRNGSYVNGTWSPLASMAADYAPLYYSSAVLADGRVLVIGGEYTAADANDGDSAKGAIYAPLANRWTALAPPPGWISIGDSPSTVLADGTFLLGNGVQSNLRTALLDPKSLTWTFSGA